MAMSRKKKVCKASSGLFVRNIGWKRTPRGYVQHKFYLGRDEAKAELAGRRLEQLWEQVTRCWERDSHLSPRCPVHTYVGLRLPDLLPDLPEGEACKFVPTSSSGLVPVTAPSEAGDRPVWTDVTLAIAEAIRIGEPVALVPLPVPLSALAPESPHISAWLDDLGRDFTGIKIELRVEMAQAKSREQLQRHGQRLVEEGRRSIRSVAEGGTLYAALDAYSGWVSSKHVGLDGRVTQWGEAQARQVSFLKRHLPDGPLGGLDAGRVDELLGVLRLRPVGEGKKPVSVSWARNCIKQLRHFLRWLNKRPEFGWKRPADLELETIRVPLTPAEKSARARPTQVQTYTAAELETLYRYATPFQRLLMLLALNCGFGRAEVASLDAEEVFLRQRHPRGGEVGWAGGDGDSWVFRVRHKSEVYGEWLLWPATVAAIDWWLRRRGEVAAEGGVTTLLVTRTGGRYDAPTKGNHPNFQIPNSWLRLTGRVRKDDPGFRRLSFNKLRKTAGNLVRESAGGEVAAVFLCHGNPVKSDGLLDAYTNRPFSRVFEALSRVGEALAPLWAGVADPFPEGLTKGGPIISPGKVRRIQTMKRQGYKTAFIAKELGVSVGTVRRWAKKDAPPAAAS
jgi:hypothetical protein